MRQAKGRGVMDAKLTPEQLFDRYVAAGVTREEIAKLDTLTILTIRDQIMELDPELELYEAHEIAHKILWYAKSPY